MLQKSNKTILPLDLIKETLFPFCFFPFKCIKSGKSFISSSGEKYVLWNSEQGVLEIVKFEENTRSSYCINANATSQDKFNLELYIPTYLEFKNPQTESSIFLWDNEITPKSLDNILDILNIEKNSSHINFFAANLQYLPLAFSFYKEKTTGHHFIELLDLSNIDSGIINPLSFKYLMNDFNLPLSSFIKKQELFKNLENNISKITFSLPGGKNEEIKMITPNSNSHIKNKVENSIEQANFLQDEDLANLLLKFQH